VLSRTLLRDAASRLLLRMRATGLKAGWPGRIPGSSPGTAMTGSRTKESVTKAGAERGEDVSPGRLVRPFILFPASFSGQPKSRIPRRIDLP
jgi:hypothetical protein